MTVVERFRRLLREMTAIERVVYTTLIVCFFTFGLVVPSLAPQEAYGNFLKIGEPLGDRNPFANPFFIAIVVVLAAGAAGVTAVLMVRIVARMTSNDVRILGKQFDLVQLLFVKSGVLILPALASGLVAAMALGRLGVYETPPGFYGFYAFLASQYFWAGIAGIAAMIYTPEYEHVLPRLIAESKRIFERQVAQDGQSDDAV